MLHILRLDLHLVVSSVADPFKPFRRRRRRGGTVSAGVYMYVETAPSPSWCRERGGRWMEGENAHMHVNGICRGGHSGDRSSRDGTVS